MSLTLVLPIPLSPLICSGSVGSILLQLPTSSSSSSSKLHSYRYQLHLSLGLFRMMFVLFHVACLCFQPSQCPLHFGVPKQCASWFLLILFLNKQFFSPYQILLKVHLKTFRFAYGTGLIYQQA
jgi:hypothetical protein